SPTAASAGSFPAVNRTSYPEAVRIYCTYQEADYETPWQTHAPRSSTGSGVVIGEGRILTGAHCVANATFLQVQRGSSPEKIIARVRAVCHDADLAVLEVDPSATEGIEPAQLGELPQLGDEVTVVGYPVGGEELSMTEGIVSRIEVQSYEHSDRKILAVTVDAAINDGNSGGPVYHDDLLIGIAFQSLEDAENIGEMVPSPVIGAFLDGIEEGKSTSVPGLGAVIQNLENPALRRKLGLEGESGGVLIGGVWYGNSGWGVLEVGDVLLEIDGLAIAANGTVRYQGEFRCQFDVVFGERFVDDEIDLVVFRDGARKELSLKLLPITYLVPRNAYDTRPDWFLFGGLVITSLSKDFLMAWGDEWWNKAPTHLVNAYYHGVRSEECQELVVISQVLADEVNVGYESANYEVIRSCDGERPRHLRHALELLGAPEGPATILTESGFVLHFDRAEASQANGRIVERYRVPADRSAALA
ncbi:MAG: serine protease, partial [Planctomycetota bacterium]